MFARFLVPALPTLLVVLTAGCASPPATTGVLLPIGTLASPQASQALTGRAMALGRAFSGARVTARRLGLDAVLAYGTTDENGAFTLELPADLPAGALLRLEATRDGQTLVALSSPALRGKAPASPFVAGSSADVSAYRRLAQASAGEPRASAGNPLAAAGGQELSPATTLAFALVARHLDKLGAGRVDVDPAVLEAAAATALAAYTRLTGEAEAALAGPGAEEVQAALLTVFGPEGTGTLPPAVETALLTPESSLNQLAESLDAELEAALPEPPPPRDPLADPAAPTDPAAPAGPEDPGAVPPASPTDSSSGDEFGADGATDEEEEVVIPPAVIIEGKVY